MDEKREIERFLDSVVALSEIVEGLNMKYEGVSNIFDDKHYLIRNVEHIAYVMGFTCKYKSFKDFTGKTLSNCEFIYKGVVFFG